MYFESDLEPNTTYTLDLTNAIADNNEGNMYPGYTLAFSTGQVIDSMAITGVVRDCSTLMPIKGATVMLYKDLADSAILKHRPDAAVKLMTGVSFRYATLRTHCTVFMPSKMKVPTMYMILTMTLLRSVTV